MYTPTNPRSTRGATFAGVIITIAIFALIGGALYFFTVVMGTPTDTPMATSTPNQASSTPRLTQYINEAYGFTLAYPETFVATTTFQGFQHVATAWRQGGVVKGNTGIPVVAIITESLKNAEGEEGYYFDAETRVGVSSSTTAVKSCLKNDTDEDIATSTVTIANVPFTVFTRSSVGMSQYGMVKSYRTVRNNVCVALELIIAGGGTAPNNPSQSDALKTEQAGILESIAGTFTFTN